MVAARRGSRCCASASASASAGMSRGRGRLAGDVERGVRARRWRRPARSGRRPRRRAPGRVPTSKRSRSASARVSSIGERSPESTPALRQIAVHSRALVRVVRGLHDRLGRRDGEEGLLDAEVDVETPRRRRGASRPRPARRRPRAARRCGRSRRPPARRPRRRASRRKGEKRPGRRGRGRADARQVDEGAVWTNVAVVLFAVIAKSWAVTPTDGSHCALGTFASSIRAETRASAARIAG